MEKSHLFAHTDSILFNGETFVEGCALLVQDGLILDIVDNGKIPAQAIRKSAPNKILAPAFIDLQVNGGGNIQFNNMPSVEGLIKIANAHKNRGTGAILPTLISDTPEMMRQALMAVRQARLEDKSILGIHFEGPFISQEKCGCHKSDVLRMLGDEDISFLKPQDGEIIMVTVAPEVVSADQIEALAEQGNIVMIGHSNADPSLVRDALDAGAKGFTHLFNAMSGLSAREIGVAGVALDDFETSCGLIADGHHVDNAMIRLAIHSKPCGKVFLVSDGMAPSGADEPESFSLFGETIIPKEGRCVNGEGKLAGSCITLCDAVRHCVQSVGLDPAEVLRMASLYPAMFLGVEEKWGTFQPHSNAFFTTIDMEFGDFT